MLDTENIRILIIDDDPIVSQSLSDVLTAKGYEIATAYNRDEAMDILAAAEHGVPGQAQRMFHVVITDINIAGAGAGEQNLIKEIKTKFSDLVVIVVTAYGTIESAVNAIKQGAFDYLTHPIVEDELALIVEKAAQRGILLAQNNSLRSQLNERYGLDNIVGHDPRMLKIYELIEAVAPTKTTVLMTGESGTGKSMIARAIHQRSLVRNGPFIELSCGSIPETLLESELFGHVKGAFTGAHVDKIGRFLAANNGTIFLDEINSASPGMQLKLLRVLQERRFEPVGSTETVVADVRVVLATNQPLEQLVAEGKFRQDLFYRINVVTIELPPVRERIGDIQILAEHFLEHFNKEMDRHIAGFTTEAMEYLQRYNYPGNIRELENVVQRAVVLCKTGMIGINDLPDSVKNDNHTGSSYSYGISNGNFYNDALSADEENIWAGQPLSEAMEQQERKIILQALTANNWNRQKTSEQLNINRTTLYKKIKNYKLDSLDRAG